MLINHKLQAYIMLQRLSVCFRYYMSCWVIMCYVSASDNFLSVFMVGRIETCFMARALNIVGRGK